MRVILGMMLSITVAAALGSAASSPVPQPPLLRSAAQVSIRILRGARVEDGRSDEPHSRGTARLTEADGSSTTLKLLEFQ